MACGSISRDCAENRNIDPTCCGRQCYEDRLDCNPCCKFVPHFFCLQFKPDDIQEDVQQGTLHHNGSGSWLGTAFGATITLEDDPCIWRVVSDQVTKDGLDLDETFDVDDPDYGCRNQDLEFLIEDVLHEGHPGTLTVTVLRRLVIPLVQGEDGCWEPLCSNCDCVSRCLCIRYTYKPDPEDEPADYFVGLQLVCSDVNPLEWEFEIEEYCDAPELIGTIRFAVVGGLCKWLLSIPAYDIVDLDLGTDCGGTGLVIFDIPDHPDEAQIQINTQGIECENFECWEDCCRAAPNTLNMHIEMVDCFDDVDTGDPCEGLTSGELDITLTRLNCTTNAWSGTATYPDPPLLPGDPCLTFNISVLCAFQTNALGECYCPSCDPDANPGGQTGCWQATIEITGHLAPEENETQLARCGIFGGHWPGTFYTTINPAFGQWLIGSSNEDSCQQFRFTLTDS